MGNLSITMTGVSPAHFTCTGTGTTRSLELYWTRALMSQASPPSLLTPRIVYLSSFSGPRVPLLIEHQRPDMVACVIVALNCDSSSSAVGTGRSGLGCSVLFA